ncbi:MULTISPECIES: hypothetical protein [Pseudofrankia]|uniref:hypothetical protein n=1 Tax=Pseudofrankia TaxID=2994363 RepID=UPI000234CA27|nr:MULTISPECIES: hypothetical protein [Pseudofrankia]OHV33403.1 hypothetical protein BCD49_27475 [Pseudofrankia sp. EUN1h]
MTTTDRFAFAAADRKLTGTCALLVCTLSLVMVPLYFVYSGPPPASNVLVRALITVVVFTLFLVFTTGLRRVLGRGAGLAGEIACTSGLVYAVMTMVAASLESGVALEYPDGSKDPTIDGPLANGMALLHGPIARLLVATFLIALAGAVHRTHSLPRRIRNGSVLLAVVNLAFVPSLFFGMDPANFYAANGWGSTASIGAVNMLWTGAIGAAILRQGHAPADIRGRAHTAMSAG